MKKAKIIIIDWNRGLIYENNDSRGLSIEEKIKYSRLMNDIDRKGWSSKTKESK